MSAALRSHLITLAVAIAVFGLALDNAAYGVTVRSAVAIVLWWTIGTSVALSLLPVRRPPRSATAIGCILTALAALTLLSIAWSDSAEAAFDEFDRVLLYLGVLVLAIVASDRATLPRWIHGLAIGISATGLLALASRTFPDLVGTNELAEAIPDTATRLSYPLGYWNGLAIFVALAVPLLLDAASRSSAAVGRAAWVMPIPVLAAVIYLSSSRGGAATAIVGAVVFLAATERRPAAAGALLCAMAGTAAAIAVLMASPDLVDGPLESAAARDQGARAAILIALGCLLCGLAFAAGSALLNRARLPATGRLTTPGRQRWIVALLAVVAVAVTMIAAHRLQAFDDFKQPPVVNSASRSTVGRHLFSGGGNGRWQLWQVAVQQFDRHPALGGGAGSYEAWWARHAKIDDFYVRDAHSLYLETLAELGVAGLVLVLAVLGGGLWIGATRLLSQPNDRERSMIAALIALVTAYALAAAIDWMWELTVVSVVAFVALGLLVGPATAVESEVTPPLHRGLRVVLVLACCLVVICEAIPFLAQTRIRQSQSAASRGDGAAAIEEARAARKIEPWASSPRLQLALAIEQQGDLPGANAAIRGAIDRDRSNWRLWLVAARIQAKTGDVQTARHSLHRAKTLNPRSAIFSSP